MARKRAKKGRFALLIALLVAGAVIAALALYYYKPPAPERQTIGLYFTKGDALVRVERPLLSGEQRLNKAINELLGGPNDAERARGLTTLLPRGARVLHLRIRGGTAIIDFNRKLEDYGGGSARIEGIIAQIVYTATEIPGITKAWIWIEGNREVVLGGEGLVLDRPLGREDLRR
jgi:spore germination protein GerM